MEEMPEDFPPRVMYDNVEAARANTERILEILDEKGGRQQSADNDAKATSDDRTGREQPPAREAGWRQTAVGSKGRKRSAAVAPPGHRPRSLG